MEMKGEFNVCQFFVNGHYEYVRRHVPAHEAVKMAHFYTHNVAAKMGIVERVIITDGGDSVVFEWKKGQGITWPEGMNDKDKGREAESGEKIVTFEQWADLGEGPKEVSLARNGEEPGGPEQAENPEPAKD